ncbi:hybrid sensor histidine kinase/response regulator, partial [Pseudomonas frederiksbergensis]|nr:hybrid sensor histidine kinase/response regulator [Pseudomonas frederiksbergensis]
MNPLSQPANRRILIIDDTPAIHQDFRKILSPEPMGVDSLEDTTALLFGSPARQRLS